jgi:hypothetical protein
VLVYCKNLVDQRTYYEFLLHKVVIGYGRVQAWKNPVVLALLLYAVCAFTALVWYHYSQPTVLVSHVYSYLAYVTPIVSFLAVIFTQWSIQGKLVTLPNFLEDPTWAMQHLNGCRFYPVEQLHSGFLCLEHEMDQCDEVLETPRMVALVEHYTKKVRDTPKPDEAEDVEANAEPTDKASKQDAPQTVITEAEEKLVNAVKDAEGWVYWEVRMLFNPRIQDDRSQSFRSWALAYLLSVCFAILLSGYVFACCLVTCLEIEKILVPGNPAWPYTHYFSLRPDLAGGLEHQSVKQMVVGVAMSAMQTGSRMYNKAPGGLLHFQIGAAAM